MGNAKDRALALAQKMREAHRAARVAESQAHALGQEIVKLLPAVAIEAEMERNQVEYQPGRYECNSCHQPVLFTEPTRKLPPCDNCGRDAGYEGPPPRVLNTEPPVPWKFAPGLYECPRCHARVALVSGSNALPPCEFCGSEDAQAV
jgi:Zn finger protein HypA/HybF involved in hydrogenase expression